MEFLCSFLRRHLVGKQAVASANVSCFLRLTQILHTTGYLLYSWVACDVTKNQTKKQSFINLGKPFFPISHIWNISQTWFLARGFVYLSFFISQILVLLYWMVCIFIFHCVTVQAENSTCVWISSCKRPPVVQFLWTTYSWKWPIALCLLGGHLWVV